MSPSCATWTWDEYCSGRYCGISYRRCGCADGKHWSLRGMSLEGLADYSGRNSSAQGQQHTWLGSKWSRYRGLIRYSTVVYSGTR